MCLLAHVKVHGATQGDGARLLVRWVKASQLPTPSLPPVPTAVRAVPVVREEHFAATATGTNGLESDYSKEAVLTVSNRIQTVTCAWDAPESNAIAYYTLYQGTAAGCYTNSVKTPTTQATIQVNPPVPSNLVVTVTSTGCTNLQYRQAVGATWTGWALLGRTNLEVTNPIYTAREWRGVGRPAAVKRVAITEDWQ